MQLFDKIVLSIYAISLSVLSFLIFLVSLGWMAPLESFQYILTLPNGQIVIGVISGLLFIVSLRFVYMGVQRAPIHAVVHDTEMGQVRISLVAVRNLVKRVASKVPGVKNVKAAVSLGAVSYTHLDVYKRQVRRSKNRGYGCGYRRRNEKLDCL